MSAGVSDQRMKGQGNQVSNVSKEQLESPGEELAESWRHQQQQQAPSYAPPISSAADPYTAQGYYGTAGTAAFPYQAFGVGDGTWSTNGTDPMTFLGGYAQHDSYGMEGVFGPSTTTFSTATFGQPTSAATFNYFHGNGDYNTWGGQLSRAKYDDYYRQDGLYVPDGLKTIDTGVQGLSLNDSKLEKDLKEKDVSGAPKKTWATIASQPAKPQPSTQSSGLKKKGPGMPPPPIIPGKHNMDIGTWDTGKSNGPAIVSQPPPPPQVPLPQQQPPLQQQQQQQQQQVPLPQQHQQQQHQHQQQPPMQQQQQQPKQQQPMPPQQQQQQPMPQQQQMVMPPQQQPMQQQPPQGLQTGQGRHPWAPPQRAPLPRPPQPIMLPPMPQPPQIPPPQMQAPPPSNIPHPVLDELRIKNNYNPTDFDLSAPNARFFVIKSYSEDDIHRSIKYEIWCSTEYGNKRLDTAFREREKEGGIVYLFFSVNGSGHFCGMAQMVSAVDYNSNSSVWAQDKWKGQFKVRWIYVKDVPNIQLRHIILENNENKPVTNSRDTQEVPHAKGLQVLRMMHGYRHSTSIFDDFIHYEKRQEEEDKRKVPEPPHQGGYKDNHHQGGYEGKSHHHGGGYEKHESYGNKGNYNREHHGGHFNREHGGFKDHGGFNKDHGGGGGFNKDHGGGGGGFNKDHGGGFKDHGGYKDHGNNGDGGYGGGGGYKGHRGGDREHGGYRDRDPPQGGGGYRSHHPMHKDRGEGSSRSGGRGRGRPN